MTKDEIAALLRSALAQAGASGLTGTDAARLIRSRATTFNPQDFGASSVKEFICSAVPAKVIGRAGMDVVFGLSDAPELPRTNNAETVRREWTPWRTWTSPASGRFVRVGPDGRLSVHLGTASPSDLAPVSGQEHRAIAEAFVATLPETEQHQLRTVLGRAEWWPAWVTYMRRDRARNVRWLAFRSKALDELLIEHVRRLGLSEEPRAAAVEGMHASRRAEAQSRPRGEAPGRAQVAVSRGGSTHALAHRVLDLLSEEQVRALSFPLGAVLDALGR